MIKHEVGIKTGGHSATPMSQQQSVVVDDSSGGQRVVLVKRGVAQNFRIARPGGGGAQILRLLAVPITPPAAPPAVPAIQSSMKTEVKEEEDEETGVRLAAPLVQAVRDAVHRAQRA